MDITMGEVIKDQEIVGRGAKGDWFVKYKGVVVFIKGPEDVTKNLQKGDKVGSLKVITVQKSCIFAEVV